MLQPVNLQLAHFNVEHSAQMSKDALAAAQQTGQGQKVVQEGLKRAEIVQAGLAAAEAKKVRRQEEEEQERRREKQRESFSQRSDTFGEFGEEAAPTEALEKIPSKKFDFYA